MTVRTVRVMSTNLKMETIDEAIASWRTHIEPFKAQGMERALMLVNRETGAYLSITIWENAEIQARNAASAGQAAGRNDMTRRYFEAPPSPAQFELAAIVE